MKRLVLRIALLTIVLLGSFNSALPAAAQGVSDSDLSVTITADKDKVKPGETITFTVTATNLGPAAAPLMDVSHSLPDQLQFISLTCDRGVSNDGILCEYLSLEPGGTVVSTLVATRFTGTSGMMRSKKVATTAGVNLETTATVDPNGSNNTATVMTKLNGGKSIH